MIASLNYQWQDNFSYESISEKSNVMRNLLYFIAIALLAGWAIGFFIFDAGGVIHFLLVMAVITLVVLYINWANWKKIKMGPPLE